MHEARLAEKKALALVQTDNGGLLANENTAKEQKGNGTLESNGNGSLEADKTATALECETGTVSRQKSSQPQQNEVAVEGEGEHSEFMAVKHGQFNDFSHLLNSTTSNSGTCGNRGNS